MPLSKYIFVTGGVSSSLGKGVSIASIGTLLESHGYKVTIQKLDPYINVDPGTMNPHQHGEVYVTDDGAETDLDLGYYERFTNSELNRSNSVTTGQIYYEVIKRERKGEYLGMTVQVIPHITDEIKNRILIFEKKESKPDFILVEVGGTVGDMESVPFLESIRQLRLEFGSERTLYIHLTLIPTINVSGEIKTKPTQHSVKELLQAGIQPDIIICRSANRLENDVKAKISLFCNIPAQRVISAPDLNKTIYEVPLVFKEENLDFEILSHFKLENNLPMLDETWNPLLQKWADLIEIIKKPKNRVKIALVGKYISLNDAYRSIHEALCHGGISNFCAVDTIKVDSEKLTSANIDQVLKDADGILIPGGFGERGINGKLLAIQYARENKIPFLGICLGMQCAVIEFARNVLGWKNANSTEFDANCDPALINLLEEQKSISNKGGTMRLGAYPCKIKNNSLLKEAYQSDEISERHRHRFEFMSKYKEDFEKNGMLLSGISPENNLVEAVEFNRNMHPWFVATQFHPEYKSFPLKPNPLFVKLIEASIRFNKSK